MPSADQSPSFHLDGDHARLEGVTATPILALWVTKAALPLPEERPSLRHDRIPGFAAVPRASLNEEYVTHGQSRGLFPAIPFSSVKTATGQSLAQQLQGGPICTCRPNSAKDHSRPRGSPLSGPGVALERFEDLADDSRRVVEHPAALGALSDTMALIMAHGAL
ncbi:hypothetical protein DIPPA_28364 [Diplonema papillatum]|nr:hypothetical protein DIPPA_23992 [Diplonema papillatum]KAJ9442290.1 hypothetical protein DIPPA_33839 [Diplonema papillatum]KAJ9452239.1 hypothetical protein DIPPA_07051 [Diplonema papillatum]KAJ9471579.1 hypothetical protein DIPPA_28364 [Diplonema papillatum]